MDLDNIQRKYGLPAPLPVVQNGKFATRFPLNLEHRGDDVFQFGGKYIGEIENIYDLLYKILTNQEIDASLALPYAIKITEDKLYIRDKTNSEWITIFDITKPNFPKEIELYELIYKAITHQVIGEDTSYPGQFKIEENILYVRDKDNLTWTQIGDVTKEFLGATEATQAILDQVNEILTEVQELKTELNRQIATTNETLTTALKAANEAMTSAQSINIRTFNSVEEMKASNTLKAGALAKTQGFYTAGDGGGADYVIVDDIGEDEADEASIIALQKGLYAKIIINNNTINVKQFGLYGDNQHYEDDCINKALNYAYKIATEVKNDFLVTNFVGYNTISVIFPTNSIVKLKYSIDIDVAKVTFNGNRCKFNVTDTEGDYVFRMAGTNQCISNALTHFGNFIMYSETQKDILALNYVGEYSEEPYLSGARIISEDIYLYRIDRGIEISDNTYLNTFKNLMVASYKVGFWVKYGYNTGERITIYDSVFCNGKAEIDNPNIAIINSGGNVINAINCSFDFIDYVAVTKQNDNKIYFKNCYIENSYPSVNNTPLFKIESSLDNAWAGCISLDECFVLFTGDTSEQKPSYLCYCDYGNVGATKFNNFIMEKCSIFGYNTPKYLINLPPYKIFNSVAGNYSLSCIARNLHGVCESFIPVTLNMPHIPDSNKNIEVTKDTENKTIKIKATDNTNNAYIYFYNKIDNNTVFIPNLTMKTNSLITPPEEESGYIIRVLYKLIYFDETGTPKIYGVGFGGPQLDEIISTEYKNVLSYSDTDGKATYNTTWNFTSKKENLYAFSNKDGMFIAMILEIKNMPANTELEIKRATIEVM